VCVHVFVFMGDDLAHFIKVKFSTVQGPGSVCVGPIGSQRVFYSARTSQCVCIGSQRDVMASVISGV